MSSRFTKLVCASAVATAFATSLATGVASAAPSGFPNGGPQCDRGSDAVVLLETRLSYAMICRFGGDGHTYYRGTGKQNGSSIDSSDVHADGTYGAYVARNNGYSYILQHEGLRILDPNANQISFEPAIYTYP